MVGKQLSDSCTVSFHRDWLSSHLFGKSHIHPENWVTFHSLFAPATPHDYKTQPFLYPIHYHQIRLDIWEGSVEIRPGVEWRMWEGLLHALIHIADGIACSTWKCQFALSFILLFTEVQLTMVTCADAPAGHLEACCLSYVSGAISVQHDILPYRDQIWLL